MVFSRVSLFYFLYSQYINIIEHYKIERYKKG